MPFPQGEDFQREPFSARYGSLWPGLLAWPGQGVGVAQGTFVLGRAACIEGMDLGI